MRFDDSLNTILSADMKPGVGAQSAWRQLVDLMSRGRIPADEPAIARLRILRQAVPETVRAASARAVAFATPGAALVGFFAEDGLTVAAPVLRTAILPAADWLTMLPRLTPEGRSILHHRRDLPGEVTRGLESFGTTDFVLPDDTGVTAQGRAAGEAPVVWVPPIAVPPDTPRSATPFVSLGEVTRELPVIAAALRRGNQPDQSAAHATPGFRIADLVKRIDAFQRQRDRAQPGSTVSARATSFAFETDRDGVIRWVDGVSRGALIGASLAQSVKQGETQVDAAVAGAVRQRARFAQARLVIGGLSDAAGSWRIAGEPVFDHASGRFTGYSGVARRPRNDEIAAHAQHHASARSDSLRQLVHELRTPTNAIAGFAELIETQLLGPVASTYREHATTIREQASALIAAIDDLDTIARIDGDALEQRPSTVALEPLLTRVARDLGPLAETRSATIAIAIDRQTAARIDDRLGERLVSRLLGAIVAAAGAGERITVGGGMTGDQVTIGFTRPRSFGDRGIEALMRIEAEDGDAAIGLGASLLGIGFALRLTRNLARELGGDLIATADRLTLRLPAVVDDEVGHATN